MYLGYNKSNQAIWFGHPLDCYKTLIKLWS